MMPKPKKRDDGDGSAYRLKDGRWRAEITVGWETRPDGTKKRLTQTKTVATEKEAKFWRNELLRLNQSGDLAVGGALTVKAWMTHWLDVVGQPEWSDSTYDGYRTFCEKWIWPVIGNKRLDKVEVEDLERIYARMREAGKAPSYVNGCHRALSRSFKVAMRRRRINRNPCDLIDAPGLGDEYEVDAYDLDEARKILAAAKVFRQSARWTVALALGCRQSEALGLRWDYVDLDAGVVDIQWQLQRPRKRTGSVVHLSTPKSKASRREIDLPQELVEMLKRHRKTQAEERLALGPAWVGDPLGDFVFTRPDGRHLAHSEDFREWKALLLAAGVRELRLHDARATAASVMLSMGIDVKVVQKILGHSSESLTRRIYQKVYDEQRRDAANRVGRELFGT